jgi:hypothetical protein
MKAIEAQLELHIKQNEEEGGHSHSKTGDLYSGKPLIPYNIPERYAQIIAKHGSTPIDFICQKAGNRPENLKQVPPPGCQISSGSDQLSVDFFEISEMGVVPIV